MVTTKRNRRVFSDEFKREIVGKATQGAKISELAKVHGLTVQTIYSWKRQLRDHELDSAVEKAPRIKQSGVDPKYVRQLEEKLRESNEKLGEMYLIVTALKKMDLGSTKSASSYVVSGKPWAQSKRRAK